MRVGREGGGGGFCSLVILRIGAVILIRDEVFSMFCCVGASCGIFGVCASCFVQFCTSSMYSSVRPVHHFSDSCLYRFVVCTSLRVCTSFPFSRFVRRDRCRFVVGFGFHSPWYLPSLAFSKAATAI